MRWTSTSPSWRNLPFFLEGLSRRWTSLTLSTNTEGRGPQGPHLESSHHELSHGYFPVESQFFVELRVVILCRATLRKLRAEDMFETWVSLSESSLRKHHRTVFTHIHALPCFSNPRKMTWMEFTSWLLLRRKILVGESRFRHIHILNLKQMAHNRKCLFGFRRLWVPGDS